ncbi:MAG TPA: YhjD/YihY/BrkB family envelope integrity protein [Actinomycetota bacterium]
MEVVQRAVRRADDEQRRRPFLAFPLAVLKRFGEDRAGQLAALIAYYGFFSLFPLLLAFVTLAGIVFRESDTQERLVDAALAQFPVIGEELRANLHTLPGKGLGLAIGIGGALWAGLAGIKAAQNAMDHVWNVPMKRQPSFPLAVLRALVMLITLGTFLTLATFTGGVVAGTEDAPVWLRVVGVAGTTVLNVLIFLVAYRVLTVEDVRWRDVFPGALVGGIAWTVLQGVGGYLIGHRMESASETYGFFAVVIGLLTWIYLGAQVLLLGAEINVVRAKRLWPRALDPERRTPADERALRGHAEVEERREEENVEVHFSDQGDGGGAGATGPAPERGGSPPAAGAYGGNGRKDTASLLRSIAADLSTLVTKQIELAKQELSEMIGTRAAAVGVMAAAAVLGLFVVGFLGLAGGEALALVLPRWAAMGIVALVFVLLAGVAILVARSMLRSAAAKPELTQASLKEDVEWAKQQLRR